ncbi:MAG: lipocalin family protein [Alphaproteobacteria bacterium]|nr:lipocalin family protein [Rickettsiales bacterium]
MFSNFKFIKFFLFTSCISILLVGCSKKHSVVSDFDMDRYLGRWYEIARTDDVFQKDCINTTSTYSLKKKSHISAVDSCLLPNGQTRIVKGALMFATPDKTKGALKVSFVKPFYSNYNIRFLAPDYSYAIITDGKSKHLRLISRIPKVSNAMQYAMLKNIESLNFKIEKLHFTEHKVVTVAKK